MTPTDPDGGLPAAYFDEMYGHSDDPWDFAHRWYERRKYALTLASLPRERYRSAFEPGCSVGVLTAVLAGRCDRLLACDGANRAVATARERTARLPHVRVDRRRLPAEWPRGSFDLIVLGELGYYFAGAALTELIDRAAGALEPGGTLVAVHWRHPVADHPTTGDEVHDALGRHAGLARTVRHEEDDFRLEVFARTPPPARSVAAATGLR